MKKYRALMSFAEDSHARTSLAREKEQESMPKGAVSGGKCSGSFAWYDRDSCLWRTWQLCLTGGLMKYLDRWPRAGMMRNGHVYRLPLLEHLTSEIEPSLYPTPCASDSRGIKASPTPDYPDLRSLAAPGALNPRLSEWLMGFPLEWTDLEHSETQ